MRSRAAGGRGGQPGWAAVGAAALLAAALLPFAGPAAAAVLVTQDKALQEAFPDARVERRSAFLEPEQVAAIERAAGVPLDSRVVTHYVGLRDEETVGTAYFDAHRVRTLPETLMVVVSPDGRVVKVEILSFDEPPDYLPRERWLDQFDGRALDPDLALKRGIRGITGATLSSRAVTSAVRRVLAIHGALYGEAGEPPEDKP